MNYGGVGGEGVRAERVTDSKEEEVVGKVGIVAELEGYLRKLRWSEGFIGRGKKRAEVGPSGS